MEELDALLVLELLSLILPELIIALEPLRLNIYLLNLLLVQQVLDGGLEAVHLKTVSAQSLVSLVQVIRKIVCPSALVISDSARPSELLCCLVELATLVVGSGANKVELSVMLFRREDCCRCIWSVAVVYEKAGAWLELVAEA